MLRIEWTLLDKLWKETPEIDSVWVFGSAQKGEVREGGDCDFGILFKGKPSFDTLADLQMSIQKKIKINDIDLVSLNKASAILRFEAISGHRLFCRDKATCAEHVSLWAREYEDAMGILQKNMKTWNTERHPKPIKPM